MLFSKGFNDKLNKFRQGIYKGISYLKQYKRSIITGINLLDKPNPQSLTKFIGSVIADKRNLPEMDFPTPQV